ncbi:hypothetical protein PoB_005043400 [Plakobranchus ocellatus]|uniref:Uncharacterized protein n=1 Tax=Plakobranchus ocellatus TaxID=259542 RepID=A0AAV4BUQ1_9GAST|nr:hypothetical protein PoB_005043400 [Plakobranchus ocellatus]
MTFFIFPWDDRGDGRPTDTPLLYTLAPVLKANGLLTHENVSENFHQARHSRGWAEARTTKKELVRYQRVDSHYLPYPLVQAEDGQTVPGTNWHASQIFKTTEGFRPRPKRSRQSRGETATSLHSFCIALSRLPRKRGKQEARD